MSDTPTTPQTGQLWQLHWTGVPFHGLILRANPDYVLMWPVTLHASVFGDRAALVTRIRINGWISDIAVWPSFETGVHPCVLDKCIAELVSAEQMKDLRGSWKANDPLPSGWWYWQPAPESPQWKHNQDLVKVLAQFFNRAQPWRP